ncbi:tRNA epoxyqueuosine(34) reductase QueG [Myroides indicus]|uniref:Epoxyqueuosine reductase n=1 Tax=Myroides indicus TaxID=1323422 RepID=A0A4R7F624_9FLAO|nr:tRNA epoxyqueuosine(34) reductase QueG [Myroides indicus]TDS63594.1 epoxyqueuosine reductase [Myroides indicus]
MNKAKYSLMIKKEALRLGFMSCGISKADFLEVEAPRLEKWLNQNMHGQMQYMENHFDKRLDPRLLVEGAKSVVSLTLNYYPQEQQREDTFKISKYAYGEDYHFVIKDKLKDLLAFIQDNIGEVDGRVFVDSAPVLDKAWAAKSGLGWIGKNNNLISRQSGSFFFIAELILDLELDADGITTDHCGTCTKCIDACPTNAIEQPYIVNGSKCISYLTIELKDAIPDEFQGEIDDWMFGCDVCQDVCPWNRFAKPHSEPRFSPKEELINYNKQEWKELTRELFNGIYKKSAVKRTKYEGLMRNIDFLSR